MVIKMFKVPLVMQLHSGENGMATLAMILAWYKKYPSGVSRVPQQYIGQADDRSR